MIPPMLWNPEERHVARKEVRQAISVLDLAEAALSLRVECEPPPVTLRSGMVVVPDLTSVLETISLVKNRLEWVSDDLQPEGDVEWLRKHGWEI